MTLDINSTQFGDYTRQGLVENVKVPQKVAFHSFEESFKNPAASSPEGMLITPDLAKFGRSEQLHHALMGIRAFVLANKQYPVAADVAAVKQLADSSAKSAGYECEFDEKVFANAVQYSPYAISPLSAFFGGIVA